jgi:hypothetical protein
MESMAITWMGEMGCFQDRLQLPFTNATSVLHNPVELVAVAPSFCKDIMGMIRIF